MNFDVLTIAPFEKDLKVLIKKYPSLKEEFLTLVSQLETDPFQGKSIGKDCYKIRLAIKSKGQGKSGGARIIACIRIVKQKIFLLSIYDKSDVDTISEKDLRLLIDQIPPL